MSKSILVGLVALGLVGCGVKEDVAADKAAEESAVAAPLAEAEAPAAVDAGSVPAATAGDVAPEGVDGGKTAIP